jgi:hypothetical protein
MMNDTDPGAILVDAHVHIYDCFDISELLDGAISNFTRAAKKLGVKGGFKGVLLLAETSHDNWFQQAKLLDGAGNWMIEQTPDKVVLRAKLVTEDVANKASLYIMAGRQIITAEGLELLALVTDSAFDDGLPIASALAAVHKQDAIPVVPWAVGKWLGKRGKLLSGLLNSSANSDLCVGDNGGRPVFWRNPVHFRQAKNNNICLLPGTDPLPFSSEAGRVGSFGFLIQGKLTKSQPSMDLKQLLRSNDNQLISYGRLESPLRFAINQVRLRMSKK